MLCNGDSMLVSDTKGVNLLIDGGEDKDILLPYLLDRGINKLEYMIISHFDSDHYGGLVDLLGKIKIKNIIISKQCEQSRRKSDLHNRFMMQI